jgi:hypothetical protein
MVGYRDGSIFGGILTLAACLVLLVYFLLRIAIVTATRENTFNEAAKEVTATDEVLTFPMSQYSDSLNFILGVATMDEDQEFDPFDNPYIEFVSYVIKPHLDKPG